MNMMSLLHEGDLIEVHNSFVDGYETIYFNGKEASRKFSFFGNDHAFTADKKDDSGVDTFRVKIKMRWFGHIGISIWKNDVCLVGHDGDAVSRVEPNHVSRETEALGEEFLV